MKASAIIAAAIGWCVAAAACSKISRGDIIGEWENYSEVTSEIALESGARATVVMRVHVEFTFGEDGTVSQAVERRLVGVSCESEEISGEDLARHLELGGSSIVESAGTYDVGAGCVNVAFESGTEKDAPRFVKIPARAEGGVLFLGGGEFKPRRKPSD